ncbi:MAG: glycoside hydrolase family 3 N-terminal domain-containing protein [Candidatus Margulisiibacteriota bacterium]
MKKYILLFLAFLFLLPVNAFALDNVSLEAKIGQMIMVGFHGTDISHPDLKELNKYIQYGSVGGVIFYARNISNPDQVTNFINEFKGLNPLLPLFFAVDQEGGNVERLTAKKGFLHIPTAWKIGQTMTIKDALATFESQALMLKGLGFNLNFAPVIDVNVNPTSPAIGLMGRAFSSDPEQVVDFASTFVDAYRKVGIISCLKHFPGHGSAKEDSHLGFTDVTDTWQKVELVPFEKMVSSGKADCIMSSHVFNADVDEEYPASLSAGHIQGVLRNKLGYSGVVVTDDLQMGAISQNYKLKEIVVRTINSGTDIMLFPNFFKIDKKLPTKIKNIILAAIKKGEIDPARIDESYKRIIELKKKII